MPAPNLHKPTKVEGKLATQAVTTTPTAILTNAADSSVTLRLVTLFVSNVNGTTPADITVDVFDGTTARRLGLTIAVPADTTVLPVIRDALLYIPAGWSVRLTASANSALEAVASYEEIS